MKLLLVCTCTRQGSALFKLIDKKICKKIIDKKIVSCTFMCRVMSQQEQPRDNLIYH